MSWRVAGNQQLFEITRKDHKLDTFDSVIDAVANFLSDA